ncbi:MAG: TonB-dependent receptor [Acidobacteriales bacterium]|nr:TonB-dependent receptor [Terriglobales bacterium]
MLVLLCVAGTGAGQTAGVTVTGVVLDSSNATVPEARVTLQRNGAVQYSATSDVTGAFRVDSVAPGVYIAEAEHDGFKPTIARLRVGSRSPAPLVLVLVLADVKQELSVRGDATQVSTSTSENLDSVALDRQMLDNLPVFDQDYIGTMSRFLDAGSVATSGVTLIVDGLEGTRASVSASAIQEVRLNQDPYSAEYPRPGRGRIEIITKPASAQFHGTFNFLFRDSFLNARDPFALTRPAEQRRIFEGNVTGPLGSGKKTSFLISVNREEEDQQAVIFALGPSGNIQETLPAPQRNTEISGSVTRQIGQNQLISIRGLYTRQTIDNQGVGGFNLPEVATNFEDREDIIYFNHRGPISGKLFNQFRFLVARQHTPTNSVNPGPKIVVLDAFTGGGAQANRLQTENHIAFNEIVSWTGSKHVIRMGINVPDISRRGLDDNTNTAGTYSFSTIQDYQQDRPFSLLRQSGNGHVVFMEKVLGGFVQDEFRFRPNLSITTGLRYDWQNYFHDNNNFAPRVSFAYAPGKGRRVVIRGGAGIFYDRSGPQPIFDLIRYDGERLLRYLISEPPYPAPAVSGPTSVVRLDPSVRLPYVLQYGAGLERQLGKSTTLSVNYFATRGVDLFRSRDVNAPAPPLYATRPDPNLNVWRQIESSGSLQRHSLEIALRGNVTRYFTGMMQYTLSRAYNDVGGTTTGGSRTSGINSFPANNYDLSGEWSRADYDQRNRFNLLGSLNPGKYFKLGLGLAFYSGMPYTMTTGRDVNNDGLANDRPAGVARNSLQGPGYADVDLRLSRDFFLQPARKDKGPTVTLGLDSFNLLNHVNYVSYVGTLTSPFFGKAVAALPTRRLQVSVRFTF